MKRLVTIVNLAILLVKLVLLGLSDTYISVADVSIPDNEATNSVSNQFFGKRYNYDYDVCYS